jgi:hypothetical protein
VQLKHVATLGNEETDNLKRILSIILAKAKYPAEFDFETKDDFESQFLAYRGVREPACRCPFASASSGSPDRTTSHTSSAFRLS